MSNHTEKDIERIAQAIYKDYTANHPTIHCNRFPSWEELPDDQKENFYRRARRDA